MSVLKKFFGEGKIVDRYGNTCGEIVHNNDNIGRIYDMNSKCVAYIECYGTEVTITDSNNKILEKGHFYENSDVVETMSYVGSVLGSKYKVSDDNSYVINKSKAMIDRIYNSESESDEYISHNNNYYCSNSSYGYDDDDYYDDFNYYYDNL